MKLHFIFNPKSGRNARRPWLAAHIRDFIAARGLDAAFLTTEGPGHATELARDAIAAGAERVIAVGGDGTMNEVAQALLFTPAALGLVPCGSGNGLALHLGIPTDPRRSLVLATGERTPVAAIDTGLVNGRPFFNAMGTGFDAEISRRFNRLARRGLPAYARTGLAAFLARTDTPVVIRGGGQRLALPTLLVAVANSDQYGNNAVIAPGARVDDGQLDLLAVRPVNIFTAIPLIAQLFARKLDTSPRVQLLRAAHFVIERPGPGLIHTDGETHETGATLEIDVRPRSLRLLVPPTARVSFAHDTAPRGFELQLP
jgi:diacylglycerol kinase (ATP)